MNAFPAADEGLPNSIPPSVLIETDRGLAVSRLKAAKAIRPSMFEPEELEDFLDKLDRLVNAEDKEELLRDRAPHGVAFVDIPGAAANRLNKDQLRRCMTRPLKILRNAKSKNLEDVLFKAHVSEILDAHSHRWSASIVHSIANDLLSADCQWRA